MYGSGFYQKGVKALRGLRLIRLFRYPRVTNGGRSPENFRGI